MPRWVMEVVTGNYLNDMGHDMLGGGAPMIHTYVRGYDLEFRNGAGRVDLTDDAEQAMVWDDPVDVFLAWKQQSTTRPLRGDGQPNRPLTALTITAKELDTDEERSE